MSQIFFTSDQHFGHRNVISLSNRPFEDLDAMTKALIGQHNEIVEQDDEVWHLGDFALDDRLVAPFLSKLRGRHHLVMGNHDRCHPCHKGHAREATRYKRHGFETVVTETELILSELGVVRLHHMPYIGDHYVRPDAPSIRYAEFRPKPGAETLLLHGHVHDRWLIRYDEKASKREEHHPPMVNVGVDVWKFAPVSAEQIAAALTRASWAMERKGSW